MRLPGIVAPVATQIEDGRLLAGGTFDVGDESPAVQPEVIDSIMASLAAALPGLRGTGVRYQWCCFRPRHPDRPPGHRPGSGPAERLADLWSLPYRDSQRAGHRPALARWIAADKPPPEAAAWSIGRFAEPAAALAGRRRAG